MTRNQIQWLVIGITLVGFALRIYHLDRLSFRGDEAITVSTWVSQPLLETLNSDVIIRDPQPPFAVALYRGWFLLVGSMTEFGIRLLPALLNTIGIPALYVLGKRLTNHRIGVYAACLWAVHPFLIWHSQDARNYAIWVVFSTLALWTALRALERRKRVDWLLYITFAAITAYIYYLELFLIFALNIYVLIYYWRNRPLLRNWFFSQIAIGLLLAPWYLQERLLFNDIYGGTTFPFDPTRTLTWIIPSLNFGRTISEGLMLNIWWLVLLLLILGVMVRWHHKHNAGLLLALTGFLPPILLGLVSLRMNVFTPRYILAVVPIYILIIVSLIDTLWRLSTPQIIRRALSLMLAGGWLVVIGYSLSNLYFSNDYAKTTDWRGLTDYLRANVSSNDIVLQAAADEAFTFYFGSLADFDRIPANPHQSTGEITRILQNAAANYASIWLVARTPGDWPNRNVGPDWLARNMQEVLATQIGEQPIDLPIQQYMPWQVQPEQIESTPLATFQGVAHLAGVQIIEPPEPTGELVIWVYWEPLDTTNNALKAFLHLVGPLNPATGTPLWAQDDHFPQDSRISTTIWDPTEIYRDVFKIPLAEVPPGQYMLHIGLYDPATGERIPTGSGDSYEISTLTLP